MSVEVRISCGTLAGSMDKLLDMHHRFIRAEARKVQEMYEDYLDEIGNRLLIDCYSPQESLEGINDPYLSRYCYIHTEILPEAVISEESVFLKLHENSIWLLDSHL